MKLKLTPLNILSSLVIAAIAYLLLFPDAEGWRELGAVSLAGIVVLSFISDILFRIYIKDIKRIWIVELAFIIFAAVLIVLIRRI